MLDAKGLEAAARKLRNAEKEKFGSWPDADDSKSIAAAAITAYLQAVGPEPAVKDDETVVEALDASGAVDAVTKAVAELQRRVDAGEYVIATLITNLKTGNCPPEKAVEWFEAEGRAALAAKDGRS